MVRYLQVIIFLMSASTAFAFPQAAAQANARETEVQFRNADVTLFGTLLMPPTGGPAPAIILLHGARGGFPRKSMKPLAERFVKAGFAALIFDQRGTGSSGGDWTAASLDDLADDAIAAATFLGALKDIDSSRVGLWGVSQAGWVIPRAIARSRSSFAFAVVITGGGVKGIEVEKYDYDQALDRINATSDERAAARALLDRYFEYLGTGNDRAGLQSAISASAGKPWAQMLNLDRSMPSAAARSKWEWVVAYDPASDIASIRIPILVVCGGQDRPGLAEAAEEQWRKQLTIANNKDVTLLFFLTAGHGITVGGHDNAGGPMQYANGYFELVESWLRVHAAAR